MWSLLNKFLNVNEEKIDSPSGIHLKLVDTHTLPCSSNNDKSQNYCFSHPVEVPHVKQQHKWDCGLACVLMVLRALGVNNGCDIQDLEKLCSTTSIWTVDLAYLLQKFSVSFTYFTVTLGANPDFSVERFYKDHLPNDLVRVNMLFQEAREAGIHIESRSVSAKAISDYLVSGKYVAIALVDHYKLSHSELENVCTSDFYSGSTGGYTGHYIVICGYDTLTNEFEIRDPGSSSKHERITSMRLERARKSFGTDEDLLLISLDKRGDEDCDSFGFFSL